MAAPSTNTSDLDRADASITRLAAILLKFSDACEVPHPKPDVQERLQQIRVDTVSNDLDKIRKDLDSVRGRLDSAAVSGEKDAADRKEKQENLDRAIQAAEKREEDAKKTEERLVMAITYAREKEAEADKKMAEALKKEVEADKKMAEAEKLMIAAQRASDAAVADQSRADSELAGMKSMRASFDADFQQRSKRLQEEEKRIMERVASISSSEGRLATNQQLNKELELMAEKKMEEVHQVHMANEQRTDKRMKEANALMKCAQEEREAAQKNLDTAVAIDRITSGVGDSVNSNSMNEMLKQADQSIRDSIDRLSSAATNVSRELAEVSIGMGELKIATQAAKTLTSDLGLLHRASRKLVADFDSTGKRPLSSGVEPTGKRARSVGPVVPTGSQIDKDRSENVSGDRMIMPPRSQFGTSVTPGPSSQTSGPSESTSGPLDSTPGPLGSTPGPSGLGNQPLLSTDPPFNHGLHPGFLFCPVDIRHTDDDTQRIWAQISFGTGWTMQDSMRLLEEFNKYTAKGVPRQMPQKNLDQCADAPAGDEKCLFRVFLRKASSWNQGEDAAKQECVHCAKNNHFCIRIVYVDLSPGEYNKDATNGKRWNITRRQL